MRQTGTVKRTTVKSRTPKNRLETPLVQTTCTELELQQKIQDVAYQLFLARGSAHGFHVEDWLAAEQIVKGS